MPKAEVREFSDDELYPLPKDTVLRADLLEVKFVTVPFTYKRGTKAGQQGSFNKWEWKFRVSEGEFAGVEVTGSTEPNVTDAELPSGILALARPWIEALRAQPVEIGESIDTDDLIGLPCQITVSHDEPRERKSGDGYWYNCSVQDVFPALSTVPSQAGYSTPATGGGGYGGGQTFDEPPF